MKHPLKYLAAFLVLFISIGAGLAQPLTAQAGPSVFDQCSPINPAACSDPITGKPVPVTKACPSSLGGFPTVQNPNLINTPSPDNTFVQCEIHWAQKNNKYVPGTFEDGNGNGVADYCSRNFTDAYRASCNNGYSDGAGAECDKGDKACEVGAYARVQLDKQGQNNSNLNPTSAGAQKYCDGKTGKAHKACIAGYQGQINGKDKDEACKNLNGNLLTTCQNAWTQAKTDSANADNADLGCEGTSNPLSWIICPVINDLLVPAIEATDNLITQEMVIPAGDIFCTNAAGNKDTCDAYYTAWASFRNIALGLIVIAGLIVIIAQAVGMEILDAYTVRKMLPRILVAAIAITLSWPLMNFAVTLSNNLGFGVRDLIIAPFHNLDSTINLNFSNGGGFVGGLENFIGGVGLLGGAAAIGASIWIAAGGLGIVLSYVVTAGLAVMIAILVLVLRQIVVIMLIILSPIAIVAYVLPNTQRVFRLWWESFSRALLMFPLIAAFIAAGRVFAAISLTSASNGVGGTLQGLIGFVAYFAPYFLIPLTFRLSGGIMSGLGGFIQQRSQGISSGLAGFRQRQRQSRVARARQTGLYRRDLGQFNRPFAKNKDGTPKVGGVGRMLNRAGFYSVNADEMIPMKLGGTRAQGGLNLPGFRRGAQVLHEQIDQRRREETSKALQQINPGYKGGRLLGGLYQGSEHDYLKGLSAADRQEFDSEFGKRDRAGNITGYRAADSYKSRKLAAGIIGRSSDQEAREAAAEMGSAAAGLDAFNKSPDTNYVDGQFLGLQAAAAEGRLGIDDIVTHHNDLHDAGHGDRAQHETAMLQQLATPKRTSIARGHGIEFDESGRAYNSYADPTSAKAQAATTRENVQDIGGSKAEDLHGVHGQAWVAKLSEMQMHHDANGDNKDGKHAGGRVEFTEVKGPDGKLTYAEKPVDSDEYKRAKEAQAQFRSMAMYASGDVGVGVEIKRIWEEAGLDPSELEFGSRRGQPIPRDLVGADAAAAEPPKPAEPAA
jgi:hypothetical protein